MDEVTPSKLTPLRWRSTPLKELQCNGGLAVSDSSWPAEDLGQNLLVQMDKVPDATEQIAETRHPQLAKRPNQAQLRAQVMNCLSIQQVAEAVEAPESSDTREPAASDATLNSAKPEEHVNCSERRGPSSDSSPNGGLVHLTMPEDQMREVVAGNFSNGGAVMKLGTPDSAIAVPLEVITFQPVDLDLKYREKELVRHVTAAKIQNREEALLNNPSPPGVNSRNVPVGEEPAAMTIEFLRARLQAERTASKATKLRVEQLSKKVIELESKLFAEVELRKSGESALQDALLKLKQLSAQGDRLIQHTGSGPAFGSQKIANPGELNDSDQKTISRALTEMKVDLLEPRSVSLEQEARGPNSAAREEMEQVKGVNNGESSSAICGEKGPSAPTQETSSTNAVTEGGLWKNRSVSAPASGQDSKTDGEVHGTATKVSRDSGSRSSFGRASTPSRQRQEISAAIEMRWPSMWANIAKEMAALAEVRGKEELSEKDVIRWMGQISDLTDKPSSDLGAAVNNDEEHLNATSRQVHAHNEEKIQRDVCLGRNRSFKRNFSMGKNVAELIKQHEFQSTVQKKWDKKTEGHQSLAPKEDEVPALVTSNGDVLTESESDISVQLPRGSFVRGHTRTQSQGESNLPGGPLPRSKSMVLLTSENGTANASAFRKGSFNGRKVTLDDNPPESTPSDGEELLFDPETELAEELPNGIFLHRSRDDVDRPRRVSMDGVFRRSSERAGTSDNLHSPRSFSPRSLNSPHSLNSSSMSDRVLHSSERFSRATDLQHLAVDQQGWPMREAHDRALRDMYYDPVINRGVRVHGPYNSIYNGYDRERVPDETIYRNGPRWEAQGLDTGDRQGEKRMPTPRYPYSSGEEGRSLPYGYRDRDRWEQDGQYRNDYRHRRDDLRGVPAWQEGRDQQLRSRGTGETLYGHRSPYSVEDRQESQSPMSGQHAETTGSSNRRDMHFVPRGAMDFKPPLRPSTGIAEARASDIGSQQQDRPLPSSEAGGDGISPHEEPKVAVGVSEDVPGEANEVLKALRVAKQQIKSAAGEQGAFMTAQYTVSQEHRYGAGGQVSKTSYTVEAPIGYPRITKVREGWHLEGAKSSSKKLNGFIGPNGVAIDLTRGNVTELISGGGPVTVSGQNNYVEKLNVGRGIQFFFSG